MQNKIKKLHGLLFDAIYEGNIIDKQNLLVEMWDIVEELLLESTTVAENNHCCTETSSVCVENTPPEATRAS